MRGDGSDLHEPEAERPERIRAATILVKARCEPEWTGKIQPERADAKGRIARHEAPTQRGLDPGDGERATKCGEAEVVRGLGRNARKHVAEEDLVHGGHTLASNGGGREPIAGGGPQGGDRALDALAQRG